MPEFVRGPDYRETRTKKLVKEPIRAFPRPDGGGEVMCFVANLTYAITGQDESGAHIEALLVMSSPLMPAGIFYVMDAREARTMGETLIRMADGMPGPREEPEVQAKRGGG